MHWVLHHAYSLKPWGLSVLSSMHLAFATWIGIIYAFKYVSTGWQTQGPLRHCFCSQGMGAWLNNHITHVLHVNVTAKSLRSQTSDMKYPAWATCFDWIFSRKSVQVSTVKHRMCLHSWLPTCNMPLYHGDTWNFRWTLLEGQTVKTLGSSYVCWDGTPVTGVIRR